MDANYYIRPMMASDLPAVTTVCAEAYIGDEIFDAVWSHSQRDPCVYPAWREWMHIFLKATYDKKGGYSWVACRRNRGGGKRDEDEDEIVGASTWVRCGDSRTAQAWQQQHSSWGYALELKLLDWQHKVLEATGGYGRAYDKKLNERFEESLGVAFDKFRPLLGERWHVQQIAVDPAHQGHGLANQLILWGVENAKAEGVPATLFASFKGLKLYERHGFDVIEWPNQARVIHPNPEASPLMMRPA